MKAAITTQYGSPDVLQVIDQAQPQLKADEILVKVHAAVVGPSDIAFLRGDPFIVKLIYGLKKPKFAIFGVECAGEVVAVGENVSDFKVGQGVFGMNENFGAHAEYICLPADKVVAVKAPQMSYEEAAGLIDGGCTALTFLRDVAKVQAGQKVLINGASGAVGAYAVQLAKYYGAEVTGVCSSVNVDLVKSLGADYVIDYTKDDFTKAKNRYDVIFDAIGKSSFSRCKHALTANGLYLTTVPTLTMVGDVLSTLLFSRKKAKFATAGLVQTKANLIFLQELFVAGKIKSVIDRRYSLEQIADAYRYVETGRKKGNVIITVAS